MSDRETQPIPGHEMWARLGKTGMVVHAVLSELPIQAAKAAERAGVGRATAFRVLPELEGYGLAVKVDGGWVRGPLSLDQAAEQRGWVGKNSVTTKRRVQFAQERWEYGRLVKAPERTESAATTLSI
jgi:hypothetical protein